MTSLFVNVSAHLVNNDIACKLLSGGVAHFITDCIPKPLKI